jgi:accessory colonization factor AcfC
MTKEFFTEHILVKPAFLLQTSNPANIKPFEVILTFGINMIVIKNFKVRFMLMPFFPVSEVEL